MGSLQDQLFTRESDTNPIIYSSEPDEKSAHQMSIDISAKTYRQIQAIQLEKFPSAFCSLLRSIYHLCESVESKHGNTLKNDVNGDITIVLFRKDLTDQFNILYGKPSTTSFFSNQLNRLKKEGVLLPTKEDEDKKQPRRLIIRSFRELIIDRDVPEQLPVPSRGNNFSNRQETSIDHSLETNSASLSNLPDKLEFAIQDIYLNGLFDPVMVLDSKTKGVRSKEKTVMRHNNPLNIQSFSDGDLMVASDQSMTRQIFSICKMEIQSRINARMSAIDKKTQDNDDQLRTVLKTQIPNLFLIDEIDLAKLCSIDPTRVQNRNNAVKIFKRVGTTRFKVDASKNPTFSNTLSWVKLPEGSESEFLMRYWEIKQTIKAKDGLRRFVFSIDDHAFLAMLVRPNKAIHFKAPLSLAKEKVSLAHLIQNWVRKHHMQQQEALFSKEFGISALYHQLNIIPDTPNWNDLPIETKKKLHSTHQQFISKSLTKLLERHKIGSSWNGPDGSEIYRSIVHGIEIWTVSYNSRKRRFKFRVDPRDSVIGSPKTIEYQTPDDQDEAPHIGQSPWTLPLDIEESAIKKIRASGQTEEMAWKILNEWKVFASSELYNNQSEIIVALNKYVDSLDTNKNITNELIPENLLEGWLPSGTLKESLYTEANRAGITGAHAKFMMSGKADEFKERYANRVFNSVSVIESEFYTYFMKGLKFSSSQPGSSSSAARPGSTKSRTVMEEQRDRSWADDLFPNGESDSFIDAEYTIEQNSNN